MSVLGSARRQFAEVYEHRTAYLWLLPSALLIFGVIVYPILQLFVTAFSRISLAGLSKGFYGLNNFRALIQSDTFPGVLENTIVWTVAVVGITIVTSMITALLLNQDFRGRRIMRGLVIIPWAASLEITSLIWRWIFDYNYGAMNLILSRLHLIREDVYWLAGYSTSFPVMIWVGIFVSIPFTAFVFLAGMQSIPKDLYEAARVDGANLWEQFWQITLPMLKKALTIATVLNTIYVFNSFPIIWLITRGDPLNSTDTMITYLYKLAFTYNKMGEAAAMSVIGFIILLVFGVVYAAVAMKGED